jgi:hypothetical protein
MDRTVRTDGWRYWATIGSPDTSDKIAGKRAHTSADNCTGPNLTIGIQGIIERRKSNVESKTKSSRRTDTRPSGD